MMSFLANLFLGRRRSGWIGLFDRRRNGGMINGMNNHRGTALATIASFAAPFVLRKWMNRRAQNARA